MTVRVSTRDPASGVMCTAAPLCASRRTPVPGPSRGVDEGVRPGTGARVVPPAPVEGDGRDTDLLSREEENLPPRTPAGPVVVEEEHLVRQVVQEDCHQHHLEVLPVAPLPVGPVGTPGLRFDVSPVPVPVFGNPQATVTLGEGGRGSETRRPFPVLSLLPPPAPVPRPGRGLLGRVLVRRLKEGRRS